MEATDEVSVHGGDTSERYFLFIFVIFVSYVGEFLNRFLFLKEFLNQRRLNFLLGIRLFEPWADLLPCSFMNEPELPLLKLLEEGPLPKPLPKPPYPSSG